MLLRPNQYLLPLFVLGVTLWFVFQHPHLWLLWAGLFVFFETFILIATFLNRFRLLEKQWRRRNFTPMIDLCRPVWQQPRLKVVRDIHAIYLAAGLLGLGTAAAMQEAEKVLEQVDPKRLAPRFANRYLLVRAQLEIYLGRPLVAVDWLKQATLQQLGVFHLARLFYFFSLAFVLSAQELERAYHYAVKASQFFPNDPLYQAQSAVTAQLFKQQSSAEVLRQVIARLPEEQFPWERRFFQQYL